MKPSGSTLPLAPERQMMTSTAVSSLAKSSLFFYSSNKTVAPPSFQSLAFVVVVYILFSSFFSFVQLLGSLV